MWIFLYFGLATAKPLDDWQMQAGWTAGQLLFDDLWAGDLVLGGFGNRASAHPLERLVFSPWAQTSFQKGKSHRFRATVNLRTLQAIPGLSSEGGLREVWVSEGRLLSEAWKERLFMDELSWRFRPDGDPKIDFRVGILPFQAGAGRYLVESWPGVRLGLDLDRMAMLPLRAELKAAVVPESGGVMAALSVRHEPSFFEHVGIEMAYHYDPQHGLTAIPNQDFSMVAALLGLSVRDVIRTEDQWSALYEFLAQRYLVDGDLRQARSDILQFLDMGGYGHAVYPAATFEVYWRRIRFTGLASAALGWGVAELNFLHSDADLQNADEDWPDQMLTRRIVQSYRMAGWAFDLLVEVRATRWRGFGFVQGMTGDPELVRRAQKSKVTRAFLSPDQAFLRTRLFPLNHSGSGSTWTGPPGIGLYGVLTPGAGVSGSHGPLLFTFQVATPMTFSPAFDGSSDERAVGRLYGTEVSAVVSGVFDGPVRPSLEGGLFFPGAFFQEDAGSFDSPMGWRLFLSASFKWGEP